MSLTALHHPGGKGRVITLDAPYVLPEGMDLRGIAGVVLKREQNPETAGWIKGLDNDTRAALHKTTAQYINGELRQSPGYGPHRPPAMPPAEIAAEVIDLAAAFQRLANANKIDAWFPSAPAPKFHIDGAARTPCWRLTYAFTGAQTIWHSYKRSEQTPVHARGGIGFPMIPDNDIGEEGRDYFASEGALMFLWNSPNGLFHKSPQTSPEDKRFVLTLDAAAPRRSGCTLSCPHPCR